ncbi:YARHG domain-containing protein [Methylobacterium brachiatum]|uniref:YARHG domain-containing protein n=1 Tax=Methylobacterium brachiatum TaxID=269660 RepID=A0ABV1QWF7_9HYPH
MRAPLLVLTLIAGTTGAMADDCAEAWYQRNLIYKQAGYCFRSQRAIRTFGNTDCRYDATDRIPLSRQEQTTVAELQAFERAHACPQ